MSGRRISFFILFFVTLYSAFAEEEKQEETFTPPPRTIVDLTQDNFERYVLSEGSHSWFVIFYVPWCPICKDDMEIFEKLTEVAPKHVMIGRIDCDANKDLKGRFYALNYPKFLFFHEGQMYQYTGTRKLGPWTKFLEGGYKNFTAQDIPPESTFVRGFFEFVDLLKHVAGERPVLFTSCVGGLIILLVLTCVYGPTLQKKLDQMYAEQEEVQRKKNE